MPNDPAGRPALPALGEPQETVSAHAHKEGGMSPIDRLIVYAVLALIALMGIAVMWALWDHAPEWYRCGIHCAY